MSEAARSPTLASGLVAQGRVIGALILRELHTRFGRDNIGYLWMIGEPMLLALGVTAIHLFNGVHFPVDIPIAPFYISGYVPYMMFRSNVNRSLAVIESNLSLLYHRHVTIPDLVLSRTLLEGASLSMALALLLCGAAALGFGEMPQRPWLVLIGMLLMLWHTTALAMLVCAWSEYSSLASRLVPPITYLTLPVSGMFFSMDWLPPNLQAIVKWVPLTQIIELIRMGVFDVFTGDLVSVGYIVQTTAVLTLLGLVALRHARRHVKL